MKTVFFTYFSLMLDTVTRSNCSESINKICHPWGKKGGGGEQRLIKALESNKVLEMLFIYIWKLLLYLMKIFIVSRITDIVFMTNYHYLLQF